MRYILGPGSDVEDNHKYDYKIMARLIIDTGVLGNAATGDTLRTAMTKANDNFSELYTDLAATTSSNGNLTNSDTNGNVKIFANGTGIVEIDRLSINNTAISSLDTNADITLTANGTGSINVSGTLDVDGGISLTDNKITASRSNDNLVISASGTGEVEMSSSLLVKGGTPFVKIERSDNANVPGVSFVGSAGTAGANILFDGTSGTANELIFQTFTVAGGIAEAFRVQQGGAKVTGSLDIDGGISITDNLITASASNANLQLDATGTGAVEMIPAVVLMANLPTSDPSNAGQLFRSGTDLKVSVG